MCPCVRKRAFMRIPGSLGVCMGVRVALLIQHSTRMRHIVASFVAPQAPQVFRHYLVNGAIFGKMLLNIKCVF